MLSVDNAGFLVVTNPADGGTVSKTKAHSSCVCSYAVAVLWFWAVVLGCALAVVLGCAVAVLWL